MIIKHLVVGAVVAAALAGGGATVAAATGPTGNGSTAYPSGLPPYWHRVAPTWCLEDMPCWIGSVADGRSDSASYVDWQRLVKGSYGCEVKRSWGYVATCVELLR